MANFEKVSRFSDIDIQMPVRKTAQSAGYDMVAAEDVYIPAYHDLHEFMVFQDTDYLFNGKTSALTLEQLGALTKKLNTKPTLISTGMKCKLDPNTFLQLSIRSSSPLKYWIILANGVGIIDADYYNNPDNEGEIFFQVINLSPFPIQIKKGDIIGQGIILPYYITKDDNSQGERVGGFGSTSL